MTNTCPSTHPPAPMPIRDDSSSATCLPNGGIFFQHDAEATKFPKDVHLLPLLGFVGLRRTLGI
jgi:hypothetical protein